MNKRILVFALFISLCFTWNLFNQVQLTKKNGAMCMDGSKASLYTYQPDVQKPPNKLLIYFQQIWQGWCTRDEFNTTIAHCYKYVNDTNFIDFGSSNNYPDDTFFLTGILSSGSIFANWYKVIIKSCDGGSYFSDSSVSFKDKTLNFRGKKNVIQSLQYLKSIGWIQKRDQVLLVGLLNGGLAALAYADYIKQYTTAKVRVLADAAVWENGLNDKSKKNQFQNRMKMADKLFMNNGVIFPNEKCQSANSNNLQKCFYASELVKYIDPSIEILFLQSYYDSWALTQILGLQCAQQFGSLSQCTVQHRNYIQQYHKKISSSLHQMTKLSNVGAFGIACIAHYFTNNKFDDDSFSVPMKSQIMAVNVTSNWLINKHDRIHLDQVQWPHNNPCSKKAVQNNLIIQCQ